MRVLYPAIGAQNARIALEAGADEIYLGYLSPRWRKSFGYLIGPSRHDHPTANIESLDELNRTIQVAHDHHAKANITFNAHRYPREMQEVFDATLSELADTECDAVIVAAPWMIQHIKAALPRCELHVSIGGAIFNAQTARMFADMGADRLVLPRHISLSDMRAITTNVPEVDYEVLVYGARCAYTDAHCLYLHTVFDPLPYASRVGCVANRTSQFTVLPFADHNPDAEADAELRQHLGLTWLDPRGCAACQIRQFAAMGIDVIKCAGRNTPPAETVRILGFLKKCIAQAQADQSDHAYAENVKTTYRQCLNRDCSGTCYYEV